VSRLAGWKCSPPARCAITHAQNKATYTFNPKRSACRAFVARACTHGGVSWVVRAESSAQCRRVRGQPLLQLAQSFFSSI